MISRRACLFSGAGALLAPGFARAADPWKKDAAEWSDKDIQQIVTKSPWAKEVTVEFKGGGQGGNWGGGGGGRGRRGGGGGGAMGDASVGGPGGGGGYGGGGGGGMGPGGGGGGYGGGGYGGGANPRSMENGPGGGGGVPQMKTTVRWESSKAIRDARKKPIRPEDAPFYILSVGPLPAGPPGGGPGQWGAGAEGANTSEADRRKWLENRLKESTRLERKGQDPIVPDRAMVVEGNGMRMLVFYFPRSPHAIQAEDKEVTFVTALGPMEIKAKFPLKDMAYGSDLAL